MAQSTTRTSAELISASEYAHDLSQVKTVSEIEAGVNLANKLELRQITFEDIATSAIDLNVGDEFIVPDRGHAIFTVRSSSYTALAGDITLSNSNVCELETQYGVKPEFFGLVADGTTNNSVAFDDLISRTMGGLHKIKVFWGVGEYVVNSTKTIDTSDSPLSVAIRGLNWEGQGGSGLDNGTKITFNTAISTDILFTIKSPFNFRFSSICFRSENNCASLIHITAEDDPKFSGHIIEYDHCTFQLADDATASDSVVVTDNCKMPIFNACHFPKEGSKALRFGGDIADFADTLQEGVVHNPVMRDCFIFGDVDIRNAKQWLITTSVFDHGAKIVSSGDKRMQSGELSLCAFLEDSDNPAFTQGDYVSPSFTTAEDAGWIKITNCQFRDRKISVDVTKGNIILEANEFYVRRLGDIGVRIGSDAENVMISNVNNFRLASRNDCAAIVDNRAGATTDIGVDKDLVISEFLSTTLSLSVTTWNTVFEKDSIEWRGGNYRVTYQLVVVNGSTAQRFRLRIRQRLSDGSFNEIPCRASFNIPANSTELVSNSVICKLPAQLSDGATGSKIELDLWPESATDVDIRAKSNGTLGQSFLQIEHC